METRIDEIRKRIASAFIDAPMPEAGHVVVSRGDVDGERSVREAFGGRHWQSLSSAEVKEWVYHFCYLSPEAYRHYLPALLTAALDEVGEWGGLMHSALSTISPSDHAVYYHGRDEWFDSRVAEFDDKQLRAVAEFLGLFLKDVTDYTTFKASRTLRFGWGRIDTPELVAFKDFDSRMRSFVHTAPADPEDGETYAAIIDAFADTPYPGDNKLCGSEQGDEPAESALDFRGVDWRHAHPNLLAVHYVSLGFLSPEAFRYFLPAYLVCDLCGFESNADPVFSLTHGFAPARPMPSISDADLTKSMKLLPNIGTLEEVRAMLEQHSAQSSKTDWNAYARQRMAGFNGKERVAIIRYLEWRAERDEFSADDIEAALESYWRPSMNNTN